MPPRHATPPETAPLSEREAALLAAARLAREWIMEAAATPGGLPASATLQRLNSALGQYP